MYVCRSLQNGLPALRFAAIRRALELCFWNWALNPHAWVSSNCFVVRLEDSSQDACSRLLDFSNSAPHRLPLAVRDAESQLDRSHALAPLWSIARLLNTGSAAGASCAA